MIGSIIALALAGQTPQITGYLRDTFRVYDASGAQLAPLDKGQLPKPPLTIVGADAKGRPGILLSGAVIYLRNADVTTRNFGQICADLGSAPRQSTLNAGDVSVGATGNLSSAPIDCIPASR